MSLVCNMPTNTRLKTPDETVMEEVAPPVWPPSVDPVLYATLILAVCTQIAQGVKALGTEAVLSPLGTAEPGERRKHRPSPLDNSSDNDEMHGR